MRSPFPAAINHLLAREPWARDKLARHAGKVAVFDAGAIAVRLKIAADGMVQAAAQDEGPSVTIRARLSDLPLIAQNREQAFSYVQIEGDADFANTISQLTQSLRWEAEEDLAKLIGDVPAVRVVGGVKAAIGAARATQQKLAENLAEYFLEENPMLVRPRTVADFSAEVNRLRDDVERLAKRIERMKGSR
ncbi:ubiquinone biosynthesis accessory factor UbiJ [Noviherbaspirillum aerium]|uniref:ubiquinone biosynthesis accessory factor UbiJ n=1 Tax=Noviherbaspirillum aerium TaxID=2588497 RepID=UPI001CEF8DC4|nr:SCP2 sterol-binding domain-containing protein [Noviherbaspirillum aerium]